ncbi:MAG: hypothetical protein RIR09_451, partial [Pseudomonadota bacterium]
QRQVAIVRGVKRASEHANTLWENCGHVRDHTQSRRTKKSLYNKASGEPGTGVLW